jgi:hypothetical protein
MMQPKLAQRQEEEEEALQPKAVQAQPMEEEEEEEMVQPKAIQRQEVPEEEPV